MSEDITDDNEEVKDVEIVEETENQEHDIKKNDILVNVEDIMHTAYLQYSLSVNVGRAIPDVRDGLKPGNRRILYAMHKLGFTKSSRYTKSAKVVGEVIGNYHPHGDSSIYETIVRMAQSWAMSVPLIDGQGNWGSMDGDSAAAYRYTECRMERATEELLTDIKRDTVNMVPTFDEENLEPEVLPARFPNLLVNGATGIGVGMATNIPPHNLEEVINATICLLDNPASTVSDLMEHITGPDFPTGAIIRGTSGIRRLYETGKGSIRVRSKAEIVEKNGREEIVITEIPYALNKEMLVKKIAELVKEKKIVGISALDDLSNLKNPVHIVAKVARNAMGSVVLNQLFKHTSLQTSFGATFLVVDKNKPKIMNLTHILQAYIDHRIEVITRRTKFLLDEAQSRAHILEGLLTAVKNIDEVVKIIRASRNREEAAAELIAKFKFSKRQCKAILEMRLYQLTGLQIESLESEYEELMKTIDYLTTLLGSRELIIGVVKTELIEVRDKHGKPRRTFISPVDDDLDMSDLIPRHSCIITVSSTGYIKRVPADTFKTQHRGGKGVKGMQTKDEDFVEHLFNADSHDIIFFISEKGTLYWLNVWEIPEGSRTSKGLPIVNLIKVEAGEKIQAMLTVNKDDLENENLQLMLATKLGRIKKTVLTAYANLRKGGKRAIHINEGDELIGAAITDGKCEVVISTAQGMACRFLEEKCRSMGRTAQGVTAIRFKKEGDYVVSMSIVPTLEDVENEDEAAEKGGPEILVISNGGMGKRSFVSTYRRTNRGAKGVTSMKLKEDELVIEALLVEAGNEIMITTDSGQLVRISTDEIRTIGRASKGVRIMRLKDKDSITGVTKIVKVEADEISDLLDGSPVPVENAEVAENSPEQIENAEAAEGDDI